MVGTTINHYKILEKIGQGGMGEVYRAEDTKLKREVAIKVLPQQFTRDPQRVARFEREAQVLASLNHPNIAAIHSFEHADEVHFLVLELVPGDTLAERLAKGPLAVDEALEVCRQIAEGVEAAHEKGVIHRDLKPANVKITPQGQVKILDFGLAKAFESETPVADISQSPTLTEEMTMAGAILGTAAYMSPEQAKGQPVDKRADIWAFGCLLYECLTAKRVFPGETITETLAAVLKSDPDWDALALSTPRKLLDLLARCLQKDSRRRLRDIGDAWLELEEVLKEPSQSASTVTGPLQETRWRSRVILGLLAGLIFGVLAAGLLFWGLTSSAPQSLMRFVVNLPPDQRLLQTTTTSHPLALSPDGTRMAYAASGSGGQPQLFLQALDQFQPRVIPGTEGAQNPFFSPDGQWVGFTADGALRRVSVTAGTPVAICDIPAIGPSGADWGSDNRIVFTARGLWQVSAAGDTPEQLTIPDTEKGERGHYWPQILPGGNAVLFTIMTLEGARLAVLALETGEWRTLERLGEATDARYLSTGHLLYAQSERLFAVPFDLAQLQLSGSPIPVLEDLYMSVSVAFASGAYYSVSDSGSLVYVLGGTENVERTLVGVDREGQETLLTEDREPYSHLDELLNMEIFDTLGEAKVLVERWRRDYNQIRPHSALAYRPPAPEAKLPSSHPMANKWPWRFLQMESQTSGSIIWSGARAAD